MKTMPRITLRLMRWTLLGFYHLVSRWEDKHADIRDYRMGHLTGGLWQAAQSSREILEGRFNIMRKHEGEREPQEPVRTVGKAWRTEQRMGEHFAAHLLRHVPDPGRPVD